MSISPSKPRGVTTSCDYLVVDSQSESKLRSKFKTCMPLGSSLSFIGERGPMFKSTSPVKGSEMRGR